MKRNIYLGVGLLMMAVSLILKQFEPSNASDFIQGFLTGLGLVLMLVGSIKSDRFKEWKKRTFFHG